MENNDKDFFSDIEMNEPVAEHSENTLQENEMTLNNQNTTSDATSAPEQEQIEENIVLDATEEQIIPEPIIFNTPAPTPVKSKNKGLQLFALILAIVVALASSCLGGYFIGKSRVSNRPIVDLELESKPKDSGEYTPSQVYAIINKSVVGIVVYNAAGKSATASGVVYSEDGYIITNDHIYSNIPAPQFRIYTFDGKEYDAKYVAGDTRSDLAVLKINSNGFYPATFGNSEEIVIGESVAAVGRPSTAQYESSITTGTVSLTERRISITSSYSSKFIQTDAAINPGSSGGALLNMYGQVIGITSSKASSEDIDRVGFAIPTTTVKRVVESLIKTGKVADRARLGISYTAVDSLTAKMNNLSSTGLLIQSVTEDSDLYGKVTAGEDMIIQVNGNDIKDDTVVLDIIDSSKPGDVLTFTILTKSGSKKTITASLLVDPGSSSYTTQAQSNNSSSSSSGSGPEFSFPFGD